MTRKMEGQELQDFERNMFRSELVSLFASVIGEKKKLPSGYTFQQLADALDVDKAQVSRWFSGLPNWEANTVSDIANALGVDLRLVAEDRLTGRVYTASGISRPVITEGGGTDSFLYPNQPRTEGGQQAGFQSFRRAAA